MLGVVSTLLALPVFEPEILPEEWKAWQVLREQHLEKIRSAFSGLAADERVLLFCHDPTALPFLWRETEVREKLAQVEKTIIGHLHSKLVLFKSRMLAGMPVIRFLGHTPLRLSTALSEARYWKPFNVMLCPSLSGIELLKDGGFCTAEIDPRGERAAEFKFHRLGRETLARTGGNR